MIIPGWTVVLEDGLYLATRPKPTDYQRRYGAVAEVDSRDADELLILAAAQSQLAVDLVRAEAIYESRRRRLGLRVLPPAVGQ